MEDASHLAKRTTLVKVRVGCVKMSTRDLPPNDHTYGYHSPTDPENAGAIISNWVASNPSVDKESERKVVYSNVLAIKHGAISAKSMRQYAIDHPNIRLKEALISSSARVDSSHEGPFGIKTVKSDVSMDSIVRGDFSSKDGDDDDYPSIGHIKKVGGMPQPRSTKASEGVVLARQESNEEKNKKHFCMKKFQNIKGKLNLNFSPSKSPSKANLLPENEE